MKLVLKFWLVSLVGAVSGESFLENSGFDKRLEPWECEEGKVIPDPNKEKNSILEVTLDEGVFALDHEFEWPEQEKELLLRFRVRASAASVDSPVQLRVRLVDDEGNSVIAADFQVVESGKWMVLKSLVSKPDLAVRRFSLESNSGQGLLWLDDLELLKMKE